jgi:hypothetical protein
MMSHVGRDSRRFRYSLRGLLIVMALAGVAFAWVHSARQQRRAVEALQASNPGATIVYSDASRSPFPLERWIRDRWGVDYSASVDKIELAYPTDADLERVTRLTTLETIVLIRSVDVTDEGLAHLARLKYLKRLVLHDAEQVTDIGLRHLQRLTSLEMLEVDLGRHPLSRQALESLRKALPRCRIEVNQPRGVLG